MQITCLGDTQARISNAAMSDEDAQALIDAACKLAADEVRQRLSHARQIEIDNQALCRERQARQEAEALANQTRLESERKAGLERQAQLREAENKNGPRRGHFGSGW